MMRWRPTRRRVLALGLVACALAAGYAGAPRLKQALGDTVFQLRYDFHRERDIMVEMRDGIRLGTTVYLPDDSGSAFPTILLRTTYGGFDFEWFRFFTRHGYAVVLQDVRGRYRSEGRYTSPHRYSRADGYDTINWIVRQPWANGKVGSFGCSFHGETQIMLAAARHPNHLALIAEGAGGAIGDAERSFGYFGVYENGVFNLASGLGWYAANGAVDLPRTPQPADLSRRLADNIGGLPVAALADAVVPFETGYRAMVEHSLTDDWWREEGYVSRRDRFSAAALHVNSWYDQTAHDSIRLARHMAANAAHPRARQQHLLIGPGPHCSTSKLKQGSVMIGQMPIQYQAIDIRAIYLDWFDYWLKDRGVLDLPYMRYYLINGPGWKTAETWPPAYTENRRYLLAADNRLAEDGRARTPATQGHYAFDYDPRDPVPTLGGPICCTFSDDELSGAVDQTALKTRGDLLLFESAPLPRDLDLAGSAKIVLYVSSSARDTDFTVKLVDQFPAGPAYNLQDGVMPLRYRHGIEQPQLAEPGEIYRLEFDLRPIAYRFAEGHRIALYLSSSNFPRLARNLNTGLDPLRSTETQIASNRVYFSGETPSHIELPVLVEAATGGNTGLLAATGTGKQSR